MDNEDRIWGLAIYYMLDNNYPVTAELAYQMDAPSFGNKIIDFLLSHSPQH